MDLGNDQLDTKDYEPLKFTRTAVGHPNPTVSISATLLITVNLIDRTCSHSRHCRLPDLLISSCPTSEASVWEARPRARARLPSLPLRAVVDLDPDDPPST